MVLFQGLLTIGHHHSLRVLQLFLSEGQCLLCSAVNWFRLFQCPWEPWKRWKTALMNTWGTGGHDGLTVAGLSSSSSVHFWRCLQCQKLVMGFSFLTESEISEQTLESYRSRSNNEETSSSQENSSQSKSYVWPDPSFMSHHRESGGGIESKLYLIW